jgi:tetratricopeptide (TPR) repeat protein
MRTLRVLIWTAALCAIIAPAAAASRADWDACESGDPDRVIACCTRIIQSPGATAKDTAIPHYNRGVAYKNKDDLDRSIADFAEAIRLGLKLPYVYRSRGRAYFHKDDNDRAIADFTEVIRLDPNFAWAYNSRGNAYLAKGDHDHAVADFSEAIRLAPKFAES